MRARLALLAALLAALIVAPLRAHAGAHARAQDDAPPNFEDHVEPILRESCLSCHRGSRARNGLQLKSVETIVAGGSSGPAIVPGDAGASLLFQVAAHEREPFMPPDEDRLDDATLAVLRAWIDGGARRTAEDSGLATDAAPAGPTFVAPPVEAGAAVMPAELDTQPIWWSERADAVVALAASPHAPLAAVAGHRQVGLWRLPDGELLGVLPFPEGDVRSLRFSASGALLVAGGGRHGEHGLAVGWDVATGARVFALGDEPDVALSADVTADHGLVALGGPDRVVRALSARDGASAYELESHTDWITAVAFSPDGVLLATADRAGGVFVWEALTGREFHTLPQRKSGVAALAWRADSMVLAVASEDGEVALFEMEGGSATRAWRASSELLALDWLRDGRLVTAGRDGSAELWNPDGQRAARLEGATGLATAVAASPDGAHVLVGDFGGGVRVLPTGGGDPVARLRPNPATIEERSLAAARAELPALDAAVAAAEQVERDARVALEGAAQAVAAAESAANEASARAEAAAAAAAEVQREAREAASAQARFARPLEEKRAARDAAATLAEERTQVMASSAALLDDALEAAALAEERSVTATEEEREAALEELRLARERVENAAATARLDAARAAEARVDRERRARALALWQQRAASADERAAAASARVAQAEEAVAQALAGATQVAAQAAAEGTRRDEASRDLEARAAEVAAVRAEREALAARLRAAEQTWADLRAGIERRDGRVAED